MLKVGLLSIIMLLFLLMLVVSDFLCVMFGCGGGEIFIVIVL